MAEWNTASSVVHGYHGNQSGTMVTTWEGEITQNASSPSILIRFSFCFHQTAPQRGVSSGCSQIFEIQIFSIFFQFVKKLKIFELS